MSTGLNILIVEARFYDEITDMLADGAIAVLNQAGCSYDRVQVPGALEIPSAIGYAAEAAANGGVYYDGYVALGCVIRGETSHYDTVSELSARGLQDLSLTGGMAIGNGIITTETKEQAITRADKAQKDKGGDAAKACLTLCGLRALFYGASAGQSE